MPLKGAALGGLPAMERLALLLDFDGTLVEIAPRPDAVVVPASLPGLLARLAQRLEGALAIVSGRPLADLDRFLPAFPAALAGEHGGVFRMNPDATPFRPDLPEPPAAWRAAAERSATAHPGVLFEPKARGFVLHYRAVPELAETLRDVLAALLAEQPGTFVLLPSHMAWEVRPRGADKGSAVATLLGTAPFHGRIPVFVGDDVTDEDGMRAARAAGGEGLQVAPVFGDPAGVRRWLAQLADA